jgi:FkbM family methyltransferase
MPLPETSLIEPFRLPGGLRIWNASQAWFDTMYLYRENFVRHCYEKQGVAIKNGDVIFDVGANVGLFALSVTRRFRQLQLYCFEPVPNTFACLTRNLDGSSLPAGHEITPLNFGLGAAAGQITIEFFPGAPSNSTQYSAEKHHAFAQALGALGWVDLWKNNKGLALVGLPLFPFRKRIFGRKFERVMAGGTSVTCEIRTLSSVIEEHHLARIDLLKIDVEGAEMDVLAGIEERHWPLIRQLAMEIEPANRDQVSALQERLKSLGFAQITVDNMFRGARGGVGMLYAVRA